MSFILEVNNEFRILKTSDSSDRLLSTSESIELPEMLLPDPLIIRVFWKTLLWTTFSLHLDQSVAANAQHTPTFWQTDNSFPPATLEVGYTASRRFNGALVGLTRKATLLEIRLIFAAGWTLESASLHAISNHTDKVVLLIQWGRPDLRQVFAWRPQHIYTNHSLEYRCYIWRPNDVKGKLALDEEAERIDDLRRISHHNNGDNALITPRAQRRPYVGDNDAIHNVQSELPLFIERIDRNGLKFRFFNMRGIEKFRNADMLISPRQRMTPRRRASLCIPKEAVDSDDSEDPPSDGSWWIKMRLNETLDASARFMKQNDQLVLCEVRLEAKRYRQTLENLSSEVTPKTV